ncbi:hypothetical protein HK405_008488, partial [Cladochytrium tenue]
MTPAKGDPAPPSLLAAPAEQKQQQQQQQQPVSADAASSAHPLASARPRPRHQGSTSYYIALPNEATPLVMSSGSSVVVSRQPRDGVRHNHTILDRDGILLIIVIFFTLLYFHGPFRDN